MQAFLALSIGILGVAAMGVVHHFALMSIRRITPDRDRWPNTRIQLTFVGLLILHVVEILCLSLLNGSLMTWDGFAPPTPAELGWVDTIYLTGVNFTTLGYTRIELAGDFRLVTMMQALGGFMFLTWSATYLFSVNESSWRQAERK